ncbi:helix-turn-helix domain-containing protein [Dyadobacter subterraneus]|uniref:Helix-turn-helix transcriptional regulator n=1 Tax=Dyadobacter subterraneus TaxID=2773304 RepID=A0ABR9WE72_9BACT|nr:helix-turn-helix transcriptional regulator [Dyadobacter subterraneus]MBE9463727.1 helix-turn-helix transcriptional regulator [Dyadobacter subterraneus]
MVSLISPSRAQRKLAENLRSRRLNAGLTQQGLSERSGVALPTLRKFEQQGAISLESFLKILLVVGGLEKVIEATKLVKPTYASIDEVLKGNEGSTPKRGRHK